MTLYPHGVKGSKPPCYSIDWLLGVAHCLKLYMINNILWGLLPDLERNARRHGLTAYHLPSNDPRIILLSSLCDNAHPRPCIFVRWISTLRIMQDCSYKDLEIVLRTTQSTATNPVEYCDSRNLLHLPTAIKGSWYLTPTIVDHDWRKQIYNERTNTGIPVLSCARISMPSSNVTKSMRQPEKMGLRRNISWNAYKAPKLLALFELAYTIQAKTTWTTNAQNAKAKPLPRRLERACWCPLQCLYGIERSGDKERFGQKALHTRDNLCSIVGQIVEDDNLGRLCYLILPASPDPWPITISNNFLTLEFVQGRECPNILWAFRLNVLWIRRSAYSFSFWHFALNALDGMFVRSLAGWALSAPTFKS